MIARKRRKLARVHADAPDPLSLGRGHTGRHTARMSDQPRTALVDESFRRAADGRGYYLMAAAIVPDTHRAQITHQLRKTLPSGQKRWHFRDESDASRRKFVGQIAELADLGVAAVVTVKEARYQGEHPRVRCLWGLSGALEEAGGVDAIVLESRQESQDRKDRRELENIKRAHLLERTTYRHDRPMEEPLLWLPDAIAGAVGLHIVEGQHELFGLLPDGAYTVTYVD